MRPSAPPAVSIVIPCRNDAAALGRTLDWLSRLVGMDEAEVIVTASGDAGGTTRAAEGRARVLWPGHSTRAALMNAGAAEARGDVLLFLHADSFPPLGSLGLIREALSDGRAVGGAFAHGFVERRWSLRLISRINRIRYRLTRHYYGDQGIFVRKSVFDRMGGYARVALMEDLDLTRRLKRQGRTVLITSTLYTSGRRFIVRGPWRTFVFIVWLLLLETVGLDAERYAERWRGPADREPGSPWPRSLGRRIEP
jgi:uncharacterized protein